MKELIKHFTSMSAFIRISWAIAILFGVYHETGVWTTIAIALISLNIELLNFMQKFNTEIHNLLSESLGNLAGIKKP